MSYADKVFVSMCRDILDHGTSTEGENVRPKWEDGSFAYTIKRFGVVNRYDLSKEFPILTLRPTALKSCTDEMLWIWQAKSNNIRDLHSHIWDEWSVWHQGPQVQCPAQPPSLAWGSGKHLTPRPLRGEQFAEKRKTYLRYVSEGHCVPWVIPVPFPSGPAREGLTSTPNWI